MKKIIALALLLLAAQLVIYAHPHTAFSVRLDFEFEGTNCTGFWEEWTFDPFFSAEIFSMFDKDANGVFSQDETDMVYNNAFINLRKYGFWTIIRVNGKRSSPDRVEQFSVHKKDARVVYRFRVPVAAGSLGTDFHVAIFDTTYYCAISYEDDPVRISQLGSTKPAIRWQREVNRESPIYYNPAGAANDNTVYDTWRQGLQTAWPEEIHIQVGQ
ncbi:MAG: DUF1007 family protein [Spirochaetes bacterium]|nr:DUF1007 family protein [Spirochaetota bacterium]MBU0956477.1 DUF1007 family protein [Spirochaetota bacterium]